MGAQWSPGHCFPPGIVPNQVRKEIRRGENHVHEISHLAQSLEQPEFTEPDYQTVEQPEAAIHLAEFIKNGP